MMPGIPSLRIEDKIKKLSLKTHKVLVIVYVSCVGAAMIATALLLNS